MVGDIATLGWWLIYALFFACYLRSFLTFVREQQRRRLFKIFDKVLTGEIEDEHIARPFFNGEITLQEEVYILIPNQDADPQAIGRFRDVLVEDFDPTGFGKVTRAYPGGGFSGIDIYLNDFVNGLELLVDLLRSRQFPQGTIIEYCGGDLPIYDRSEMA